uniref:C-type lectin domain-containing protein n=1 Tax=Hucho hucho TaxID=62062 RepID=A0A4W5MCF5_9TELE
MGAATEIQTERISVKLHRNTTHENRTVPVLLVYRTSNNSLTEQRDKLQIQNKNLDKEKADLQRRYNMLNQTCLEAWKKFGSSLYYISDRTESWDESRQNCLKRGADLVIINNSGTGINLETKVTWKWVDGTLMTTGYWSPGEPNGVNTFNDQEKNWNGLRCSEQRHWISLFYIKETGSVTNSLY